jgi:hypothetical protein
MNPYIIVLGIGCGTKQPLLSENTNPPKQEDTTSSEEQEIETEPKEEEGDNSTLKKEISQHTYNPPQPEPIRTVNPPAVNIPQPPSTPSNQLPRWDDVMPPDDIPSGTPTPGLALSSDHQVCYKEWFAERSVHPHVRRYGGRILLSDEKSSGTRILCSEAEKTAVLSKLKEAGIIPSEAP